VNLKQLARLACLASTLALVGCASVAEHAHNHAHDHADRPLREGVSAKTACRQGAFVEAQSIVNSVVDIAMALPSNTPERTRNELDTILYTAFKQAKAEVHCVAGSLSHGYEKSFANPFKRAVALAQSRRLSRDVIEIGQFVIAAVEKNEPIESSRNANAAPALTTSSNSDAAAETRERLRSSQ
jgi:hypothetical protein